MSPRKRREVTTSAPTPEAHRAPTRWELKERRFRQKEGMAMHNDTPLVLEDVFNSSGAMRGGAAARWATGRARGRWHVGPRRAVFFLKSVVSIHSSITPPLRIT